MLIHHPATLLKTLAQGPYPYLYGHLRPDEDFVIGIFGDGSRYEWFIMRLSLGLSHLVYSSKCYLSVEAATRELLDRWAMLGPASSPAGSADHPVPC